MKSSSSFFSREVIYKVFSTILLEFGPVFLFLFSFERFHIYKATIILMVATIISTVATFKIQKRLPYLALYVAFLTSVFGFITISLHQPKFIQMRDTLYDLTCGITLLLGMLKKISFLEVSFGSALAMTKKAWSRLTYFWIVFFFIMAGLNEYVRTNFSLDKWFEFKSVVIVTTVLFGFFAIATSYEKKI